MSLGTIALCLVILQLTNHRLLESVTNLFTLLSNPSNVSLLTSQLLSAPAIWSIPTYGQSIVRVVNVFASASIRVIRRQEASDDSRLDATRRSLGLNDWTVAVVKGASVGAPRSRHVLVFAGLLQGFENQRRRGISTSLHAQIQDALITATNSSLRESAQRSNVTDQGLIFAVGLIFDTLATRRKTHLDHDLLLPTLTSAVFFSDDGLRQGYFLSPIDADIVEEAGQKFHWSIKSPSYRQLQSVTSSPLVASLGRLSRVAAFSVGQVKDTAVLTRLLQDSFEFSRSLSLQWRQNKLSEIDASEEMLFLSEETLRTPVPLLWRVLRISMFAIVVILSSCTGRLLSGDFQGEHDG